MSRTTLRIPGSRPLLGLGLAAAMAASALACNDTRSLTSVEQAQFTRVTSGMAKAMKLDPQTLAELGAATFVAGSPADDPYTILFDFTSKCLTTTDTSVNFNNCKDHLGGQVQGTITAEGGHVAGALLYLSEEGTASVATTLTIGSQLMMDIAYDGQKLNGSVNAMVAGMLADQGYNVRGNLTFKNVELDDKACPVGGSTTLDVAGVYADNFSYKGAINLRFGPNCNDVDGEVTGDLVLSSGGQDTTGSGTGQQTPQQGAMSTAGSSGS
jgi:hypothetical protein